MEHNRVIYERPIYDSEIEYIQNSNSLEAIDSLFVIPATATSLKIEAKFCFTNHTRYQVLCGYQNDGFTTPSLYLFYSQNTTAKTFYIGSTQRTDELNVDLPDNFIFDGSFTMQNGIATVYGNNGSINKSTTYNNNLWKGGSYSLIIMGGRVGASHIGEDTGIMKLYKFSITLDNLLVRDFIPVRVGQTGYLYDKVSHKLFGAISGNFILGQDVANPVPNIRRVFRFDNKRFVIPMPYDSKIEYLESTGTQYIDTEVIIDSETAFAGTTVDFQVVNINNGTCVIAGSVLSEGANRYKNLNLLVYNNKFYTDGAGWRFNNNVNNITLRTIATATGTAKGISRKQFLLFARYVVGLGASTSNSGCRIFSCKMYENEILIRDFIPVRRGNVGYLYDKVSGKLFGNAGTGQFILGNDIND